MSGISENPTVDSAATPPASPVETQTPQSTPEPAAAPVQAVPQQFNAPQQYNAPQQQQYNPEMLAEAFMRAVQPLVPKPSEPTPIYETDDWLTDRKTLKAGIEAIVQNAIKGIDPRFNEFAQKFNIIEGLIPRLYARSAERPEFGQIESKASELRKEFPNLDYLTSVQLAQKMGAVQPVKPPTNRPVPGFASSPNTSVQPGRPGLPSGKTDFSDIVKTLRATHGDNIPDELLT